MDQNEHHLLLADDDDDDCLFFKEALDEIPLTTSLQMVHDGVELMDYLSNAENKIPDVIFLDLNMPRKNGFQCLDEIKSNTKLQTIPVIIISTSRDIDSIDLLYKNGAQYYIKKPGGFAKLKYVILEALTRTSQKNANQPTRADFVILS